MAEFVQLQAGGGSLNGTTDTQLAPLSVPANWTGTATFSNLDVTLSASGQRTTRGTATIDAGGTVLTVTGKRTALGVATFDGSGVGVVVTGIRTAKGTATLDGSGVVLQATGTKTLANQKLGTATFTNLGVTLTASGQRTALGSVTLAPGTVTLVATGQHTALARATFTNLGATLRATGVRSSPNDKFGNISFSGPELGVTLIAVGTHIPSLIQPVTGLQPCDWRVSWDEIEGCCTGSVLDSVTADQRTGFIAAAVAAVWTATGRRWGLCPVLYRPFIDCRCGPRRSPYNCACGAYERIDLTGGGSRPVAEMLSVILDGVTLVGGIDYSITDRRWLNRLPRHTRWPACNDQADPAVPALVVSMLVGELPPQDLIVGAVGPLACEAAKACAGQDCGLNPAIVQSVQREGVSFALVSAGEAWKDGGFGNPHIDGAIRRDWAYGNTVAGRVGGVFDPRRPPVGADPRNY